MSIDKIEKDDIHVRLPKDLMEAIRREAKDTRSTPSEIIEGFIVAAKQEGPKREDFLMEHVTEIGRDLARVITILETLVSHIAPAEAVKSSQLPDGSMILRDYYDDGERVTPSGGSSSVTPKRRGLSRLFIKERSE